MKTTTADRLRAAVLDGIFGPGERLVESELVERLGVSRGAIRLALVELEKEGLVERRENRGAKVKRVALAEAILITEARRALETLCAARAALEVTDEGRERLEAIVEGMRIAVAETKLDRYSELNNDLHVAISEIGRHSVASELIVSLRNRSAHHQYRVSLIPNRVAESLQQHERIVAAICSGDSDEAEAAIHDHLESVISALRSWDDVQMVH